EGHEVFVAANDQEALTTLQGTRPDVVLLDLGLPGKDGLDVLAEAQGRGPGATFIVITARDDMNSTVKAVQLGAYDYLVKPLDIDRVKLTVERALESREASHTMKDLGRSSEPATAPAGTM